MDGSLHPSRALTTMTHTEYKAMLAIALSGLAWGIFWVPLRALDEAGVTGVWAIVLFSVLPALLLTPVMALRWRRLIAGGRSLHAAGLLAGSALVLYAGALVFTEVVRALVFFYLTPIWSTLLARFILGERITIWRWVTIALGALGMALLLRFEGGLSSTLNAGDLMGLASGVLWAGAAVMMKASTTHKGSDFALSYFIWGSIASLGLIALPLEGGGSVPDLATLYTVLPWFIPVALFVVLPPSFAMMWGTSILSPGLVAILFMTEISAGAVTAAIWADEPFGWREITGVLVICCAGLLEPIIGLLRTRG